MLKINFRLTFMRNYFFAAVLFISPLVKAGDGIVTYPVEKTAVKSTVFSITANGHDIFTQKFKDINYVHFAHQGVIVVSITCAETARSIEISPRRDVYKEEVTGNKITFQLAKPGYHVITLNHNQRLFILTDDLNDSKPGKTKNKLVNVMSYGADSTGSSLCTVAIQKALDETARQKKVLYFPAGIYKSGTIKLSSNSYVFLEAGAMIKGSENRDDYPVDAGKKESDYVHDKEHYTDNGERMTFSRLILIDSAVNVKIWGRGTIDGSGSVVRAQGKPANLIRIRNSRNVLIEGLLLRDPACWNTHILHSKNITIRNIKMINDRSVANTDGFDPDASAKVLIDHCFAYCSDDNIAIKTTNNGGLLQNCENIIVSNCVFLTKKSSLKLGTETKGSYMHDITFKNNYVVEADRGMVLYCYDGAIFKNIRFINNYFEKGYPDSQKKAIHFQIKKRNGEGQIENVLIRDCTFSESFQPSSEMAGLDSMHTINGIKFKNLSISGKLCLTAQDLHLKTNENVQNISFEK